MRFILAFLFMVPILVQAQDAQRFQRAMNARNEKVMDRWVKRRIDHHREGQVISTASGSYRSHAPTFDSLVAYLRRQPGVEDAAWDKCIGKQSIWPGHSTIGMRWHALGRVYERCWNVQEGKPGTIHLFGWRPRVRKSREHLLFKRAAPCAGFVDQQRKWCTERHIP